MNFAKPKVQTFIMKIVTFSVLRNVSRIFIPKDIYMFNIYTLPFHFSELGIFKLNG